MRKLTSILLGCLTAALIGTHSGATDTPTIRISSIVVPPLVLRDEKSEAISGTAVEALRRLAEKCGVGTEIIITPSWNRAYMMAQIGIVDGVIPTNYAEDRLEFFDFPSKPLVDMSPTLIVRKDSSVTTFSSLEMLAGKRVGVRTNALLEDKFDTYVRSDKATLVERSDSKSLVDELLSGRVDFIADSPAMIIYHMTESNIPQRIRVLQPPLGHSGQFLALSKKRSPAFAEGTGLSECLLGN
ncbi:MAG: transporter substrate-binding domain-containing protein [Alphaproteobacteria bacterium]|nr:transporter substrate-binding domain-containing protein [Alphaproteobacteria bacterium]